MDKELLKLIRSYKKGRNMDRRIEAIWLERFYELIRFKQVHEHANVPSNVKEFKELSHWVANQRKTYKLKTIDPAKIELLERVDFKFRLKSTWYSMFRKLVLFKKEYGHTDVTANHKEKQLYVWLKQQRKRFKAGELDKEKFSQLTNIGFVLDPREIIWDDHIEKLKAFKKQYGHLQVCPAYTKDKQLLNFVRRIRYQKSKISPDKITKLERMGFAWSDKNMKIKGRWLLRYEQLKEFKNLHGHCQVSIQSKEYHSLGVWVYSQRRNNSLSEEKRRLLDQLDFFENKRINVWHKKVDQLVDFKEKNGHLYITRTNASPLYSFIKHMRRVKHKLSKEQVDRLNSIGFIWKPGEEGLTLAKSTFQHANWLKHYEELRLYKNQYGHCRVPTTKKKFQKLSWWVNAQKYSKSLTNEQLKLLNDIDFFEDYGVLSWEKTIKKLLDFKKLHGHLHVSQYSTNDRQLLNSVKHIKINKNQLTPEKISMLNDIGFVWKSIDPIWIENYEKLKEFKKQNRRFLALLALEENRKLHRWVNNQVKNSKLSTEKRKLLNKIGFFKHFKSRS